MKVSRFFSAAVLTAAVLTAAIAAHKTEPDLASSDPPFPAWPQYFSRKGTQINSFSACPYDDDKPSVPYIATKMESYYDWRLKALREVYHDACVPIFSNGSQWSCDFLNLNGTSYLLQHEDRPEGQPECCIFLQPWNPPAPDFLAHSGAKFLRNTTHNGATVMWFQSDVSPQQGGPFGYGYAADGVTPVGFYFGGFWNYANGTFTGSMIMQYYEDFDRSPPPASTWALPKSCEQANKCTNWP